jgi:hypothetical protein
MAVSLWLIVLDVSHCYVMQQTCDVAGHTVDRAKDVENVDL